MEGALYIDVGSPYVYLALERLPRLGLQDVALKVVSLGAIFKARRRSSWGMSSRRELGMAEVQARASAYGLPPVRWPQGWPSNYLHANRACLVAEEEGALGPFVQAAMRAAFVAGEDLGREEAFLAVAEQVGLDAAAMSERIVAAEIKNRLREQTEEALSAGVFGVPTLIAGGRVFWGDDQLELAVAARR
jgi:2-hydroxychromene-2-carboxylate isomerase